MPAGYDGRRRSRSPALMASAASVTSLIGFTPRRTTHAAVSADDGEHHQRPDAGGDEQPGVGRVGLGHRQRDDVPPRRRRGRCDHDDAEVVAGADAAGGERLPPGPRPLWAAASSSVTSGVPDDQRALHQRGQLPSAASRPMKSSLNAPAPSGGSGCGRLTELADREGDGVLQLPVELLDEVAALGVDDEEAGDGERHGDAAEPDEDAAAQPHGSTRRQ